MTDAGQTRARADSKGQLPPENEKSRVAMAQKLRAQFMTAITTKAFQNNPFPGKARNRKAVKPVATADVQAPAAR